MRLRSLVGYRRSSLLCAAALAVLLFSSSQFGHSSTQPSAPVSNSDGPNTTEAADTEAPRDASLTTEEYLRLGMPAQDREWFAEDMVRAVNILTELTRQGYGQLPRYKSERSGDVFARMTSPQNLSLYKDSTIPLESRLPLALTHLSAGNQIQKLYLSGFLKNEVSGSELVELMGSLLRSVMVMLEVVDEFLPTIKKDDPKYEIRMQGLDQMRRGLANIVAGSLQTLTERNSYRASELARLVSHMQETFPPIVSRLPPGARTETMLRLEKMQEDPLLQDLQPGLAELRSKVKSSLEMIKVR